MLSLYLGATLALFLSSFVLARRSFGAAMIALLGSIGGLALLCVNLVLAAQASLQASTLG